MIRDTMSAWLIGSKLHKDGIRTKEDFAALAAAMRNGVTSDDLQDCYEVYRWVMLKVKGEELPPAPKNAATDTPPSG